MPTYDYECNKCGEFEIYQHMSEDRLTACTRCGSKKFQRIITKAPAFMIDDMAWEQENGGRGRYISQLAEKQGDPNAYCRSKESVREKAKIAGFQHIDGT